MQNPEETALMTLDWGLSFMARAHPISFRPRPTSNIVVPSSSNGDIWCTGSVRNFAPERPRDNPNVGDEPDETSANFPPFPRPLDPFTHVTTGADFSCGLTEAGQVICWGQNGSGQLGQGVDAPSVSFDAARPVNLGQGRTARSVEAGGETACALLDDNRIKCWGANDRGQLGSRQRELRGTAPEHMGDNLAPIALGTGRHATQVSVGEQFACALLDNGGIKCWGSNQSGQLGQGEDWLSHGTGRNHMGDALPEIRRLDNDLGSQSMLGQKQLVPLPGRASPVLGRQRARSIRPE